MPRCILSWHKSGATWIPIGDVSAVIITGAGKAFSGGGDLDLVKEMSENFDSADARLEGSARPCLQHHQLLEAHCLRHAGSSGRCRPGRRPSCGYLDRGENARVSSTAIRGSALRLAIMPRSSGRCSAGWRNRNITCCSAKPLTGEEAERIGLVSLCVEDDQLTGQGARGRGTAGHGSQTGDPLDEIRAEQLAAHGRAPPSTPRSHWNSWASVARTCARDLPRCDGKRPPNFNKDVPL